MLTPAVLIGIIDHFIPLSIDLSLAENKKAIRKLNLLAIFSYTAQLTQKKHDMVMKQFKLITLLLV